MAPNDRRRTLLLVSIPGVTIALIAAAGLNYRWARMTLDREAHQSLDREWSAMKGYLRLERGNPNHAIRDAWYYDADDADEADIVKRIQARCFIADAQGQVLRASLTSQEAGLADPEEVQARLQERANSSNTSQAFWAIRRGSRGQRYLVRAGIVMDEGRRSPFYVALATPLNRDQTAMLPFTTTLVGSIALAMLLGSALACAWRMQFRS